MYICVACSEAVRCKLGGQYMPSRVIIWVKLRYYQTISFWGASCVSLGLPAMSKRLTGGREH
jgi:hypothetical protein